MLVLPLSALAQIHVAARTQQHRTRGTLSALVKRRAQATERFKDVAAAEAEAIDLLFGCVSGPDSARWACTT